MIQNVIVLSASQYRVPNDKGGIEAEGTTVRYLMSEDLTPFEAKNAKGRVPAKANMPYEYFDKFTVVPALYEGNFDYSIDSKGKAVIMVTELKLLSALSVTKVAAGVARV